MEALPVQEPYSANQGERQAHQDQQGFVNPAECQIQQDENDHHRHRHHQLQFLVGMLKQFKLSGECHTGSRSQFHFLADGRLNVVNHRHHVPAAGININPAGWPGIFGFQHGWSRNDVNIRDIAQRDLLLHRGQDRHLFQRLRTVPVILRVANVNRVPGHPFNCLTHHSTSDC